MVKMIDRETIIRLLCEQLEPLPYIYAFWLEGADANGMVDEYSDIDFWLDIEDEYLEQAITAVEAVLSAIAVIEYRHVMPYEHPQIRQRIYHLAGTSEYLVIDFCWQLHSRDDVFLIENNDIEAANVLFDKCGVIWYKPFDRTDFAEENTLRLDEAQYCRTQHSRVKRYLWRERYLEAYAKYIGVCF